MAESAAEGAARMTEWTREELDKVGGAEELQVASMRPDGTLRPFVIIWVVRVGEGIYVRSAFGRDNPRYRRALASGVGRIRAGGVEREVSFADPEPDVQDAIDAAYQAKYDRYGPELVGNVVGDQVHDLTIHLLPR
jgi:hypothetical protein